MRDLEVLGGGPADRLEGRIKVEHPPLPDPGTGGHVDHAAAQHVHHVPLARQLEQGQILLHGGPFWKRGSSNQICSWDSRIELR